MVSNLGDGPSNNVRPFYTYTWELTAIFGDQASDPPVIFTKDCTLPTYNVAREDVESAALVYKFAAQANWDDIRLTFYDIPAPDGGKKLADTLREWRTTVWNAEGGIFLADVATGGEVGQGGGPYKQRTTIRVFNMDDTVEYSWILNGSWPQQIKEGELTYTDSDVKIVEVIIVYDYAEIE